MLRFQPIADGPAATAFSNRTRSRRFRLFERLCRVMPRPVRILDIGGTTEFWEQAGWAGRADVQITLLNPVIDAARHANLLPCLARAEDLDRFPAGSFDVAVSNSVIEHLFTSEAQRAMAGHMQRIAAAHWLQTPNYWFPIEPHFYFPGWQWLPRAARIGLVRRFRCGCRGPCPDAALAARLVDEVRLLRRHELAAMFPRSRIVAERCCGLVKSWIVHGGFGIARASRLAA